MLVLERAKRRCEYCRTPLEYFQLEHIVSRKLGGSDDPDNLACACLRCNLAKGTLISGLNEDGEEVRLFNPRSQPWDEHFRITNGRIDGLTSTGRVTVKVLNFNTPERLDERQ